MDLNEDTQFSITDSDNYIKSQISKDTTFKKSKGEKKIFNFYNHPTQPSKSKMLRKKVDLG